MKSFFTSLFVCIMLLLILVVPVSPRAMTLRENDKEPFYSPYPVYFCDEPVMILGGDLHRIGSLTFNDAGAFSRTEMRFLKIVGEGNLTGKTYHYRFRSVQGYRTTPANHTQQREQISIMLIGQGTAQDAVLHCEGHRITNPDGEVTAYRIECKRNDCEGMGLG